MGGFTKVDNRALKLFGPGSMERAVYLQMCSEAEFNGPTEKWSQGVSVPLNNGQLIFGRRAWAEKFGVSEGVIRGVVDRLLATHLINQMRTGKNCVVTITYLAGEPDANRSRTADEPPINPISKTEDLRQKTHTSARPGSTSQAVSFHDVRVGRNEVLAGIKEITGRDASNSRDAMGAIARLLDPVTGGHSVESVLLVVHWAHETWKGGIKSLSGVLNDGEFAARLEEAQAWKRPARPKGPRAFGE